jgi:hypothetical protein
LARSARPRTGCSGSADRFEGRLTFMAAPGPR